MVTRLVLVLFAALSCGGLACAGESEARTEGEWISFVIPEDLVLTESLVLTTEVHCFAPLAELGCTDREESISATVFPPDVEPIPWYGVSISRDLEQSQANIAQSFDEDTARVETAGPRSVGDATVYEVRTRVDVSALGSGEDAFGQALMLFPDGTLVLVMYSLESAEQRADVWKTFQSFVDSIEVRQRD